MNPKLKWLFALALTGYLLINFLLIPSKGTGDVENWTGIISYVRLNPDKNLFPSCLNHQCGVFYPVTYPPGHFLVVYLAARLFPANVTPLSTFKLTVALFYLLGFAALYFYNRSQSKIKFSSLKLALLYFSLPSFIINTQGLGYTDIFYVPFLILFLMLIRNERYFWSGLCFGVTLLIKWQPIILLPLTLVFITFGKGKIINWRKTSLFIGGLFLMQLPILLLNKNYLFTTWNYLINGAIGNTILSAALNLQWLVSFYFQNILEIRAGSLPGFLIFSPDDPFRYLLDLAKISYLIIYLLIVVFFIGKRSRRGIDFPFYLHTLFAVYFSYFMLSAGVHENHLIMAVVLALLLFIQHRTNKNKILLFFTDQVCFWNMFIFYGLTGIPLFAQPYDNPRLYLAAAIIIFPLYLLVIFNYFLGQKPEDYYQEIRIFRS